MGALYRPRVMVRLFVPNVGTPQSRVQQEDIDNVTQLQVLAHSVRLVSNSLNEADECELQINYDDAGIDPRFLRSAEVYVYFGDGDELGDFTPSTDNLRFVGIVTSVERSLSGKAKDVKIHALDYTTLFIADKQYPPASVPDFSQTIQDAWRRVCDNTGYWDVSSNSKISTVQRLKDRLRFVGVNAPGPTLGTAVSERLAKLGKLQVKHGADAWAIWQTAVGSVGLVSFIRGDQCVVTTATDFYTANDPPKMLYGLNIQEISERRDVNTLSAKNVGLFSFDPMTGKSIEAYWPPLSPTVPKKKRAAASALGSPAIARAQDYEIFDSPQPTSDPAVLQQIAKRVWEERTRQELSGELKTGEMFVDTLAGDRFDLLKLQSGDRIRVDIDRTALTQIQQLPSLQLRINALLARGYSHDMADFICTNLDSITSLPAEFQVHSVETQLQTSGDAGGQYEMTIRYVNRIDVSGASQAGTGTESPPITGQTDDVDAASERRRNGVPII